MANNKCKYCYGKGYSTRLYQERGYDDFGGEGYITKPREMRVACRCVDPIAEARQEPMFRWHSLQWKIRLPLSVRIWKLGVALQRLGKKLKHLADWVGNC